MFFGTFALLFRHVIFCHLSLEELDSLHMCATLPLPKSDRSTSRAHFRTRLAVQRSLLEHLSDRSGLSFFDFDRLDSDFLLRDLVLSLRVEAVQVVG